MNGQVYWNMELEVMEGRESDVRALMAEMVSGTKSESGTLAYEWSVSPDGRQVHILERYADSAAVLAHVGEFGAKYADRFLEQLRLQRFVVYGSPSVEVKEALAGFNPVFMPTELGFRR